MNLRKDHSHVVFLSNETRAIDAQPFPLMSSSVTYRLRLNGQTKFDRQCTHVTLCDVNVVIVPYQGNSRKWKRIQLSVMDVLARTTMKDAAKCDRQCELQNSVNHQTAERKQRSWVIPKRMSTSVFPQTSLVAMRSDEAKAHCGSAHGEIIQ